MPAPTIFEWLVLILIDGAVLACAAGIGWWCWQNKHHVAAVAMSAPLFIPVGLGLWALFETADNRACSPGDWFCFTPIEAHWIVWTLSWVLTALSLTFFGFIAAIWSFVGPPAGKLIRKLTTPDAKALVS
jgi:hypothetical protein